MPSLIDLRRRIRAVKNTQQITKAMKMVAASKLRRAQERIMNARPYAVQMQRVLGSVAARVDPSIHPLLTSREPRADAKTLLIIVTGRQGALRQLQHERRSRPGARTWSSTPAGARSGWSAGKGATSSARRGFDVVFERIGIFQKLRLRRRAGDCADRD